MEFTNVRSLIDGIAGIAGGQVGNLVSPHIILTTVSQLEPIKAYFTVSEQPYLAFVKRNPTVAAREAREKQFELDLVLADGSTYPRKGKFYAADRQVDVQTGAIRLAALCPCAEPSRRRGVRLQGLPPGKDRTKPPRNRPEPELARFGQYR